MMRKLINFLVIALSTILILSLLSCSPKPANFNVSALTITPNKVVIGGPVYIEILITNNGALGGTNPTFIAFSLVGKGRVICMGSSTPIDNFAIEDGDNNQLGYNLISFAAAPSPETP